jgi:hypothetical protein
VIGASLAVGGNRSILARGAYGDDAEELRCVDVPVVANQQVGKTSS